MSSVGVTDADIAAAEAEVMKQTETANKKRQEEISSLLDEAQKKGKELALKEFEDEQRKRKLEEENQRLSEELKKTREEMSKKMEQTTREMEAKIQELASQSRGITRNESPFATPKPNAPNLSPEMLKEIDRRSADEFARAHGFRFTSG